MRLERSEPAGPLLEVEDLRMWFPLGGGALARRRETVKAVDGVSFAIKTGEVLGLVGESGSGKTTVGRTILRLIEPTGGAIRFGGADITHLTRRALRPIRQRMQLVFQDPFASLNPRMTIGRILAGPLMIHRPDMPRHERENWIAASLTRVGLAPRHAGRYPHEFSGGQRQRVGIARALMLRPDLVVADEPVSALDVSIQAQVVNLLLEIRDQLNLAMLFIAHDLAVVAHISDRIAVMYLGRIVELAPAEILFSAPRHPYTEALLAAAPVPDPDHPRGRPLLSGDVPSPVNPPSGCAFRTRCRYQLPACAAAVPPLREVGPGHLSACIRDDITLEVPI
ncbi:MAG: ABC transporter ATP-binding protein [Acetobacteraceae bacterium]